MQTGYPETRLRVTPSQLDYLERLSSSLPNSTADVVRVSPLALEEATVEDLLKRRLKAFDSASVLQHAFGYVVPFSKAIRPVSPGSQPRNIEGVLAVLPVGTVALVTSRSDAETYDHGGRILERVAYPLASRPFIQSNELYHAIVSFAQERKYSMMVYEVFSKRPGGSRRNNERQDLDVAFQEMYAQRYSVHRISLSFGTTSDPEHLKLSVDRHARLSLYKGSATEALTGLCDRLLAKYYGARQSHATPFARDITTQKALRLAYPASTFRQATDLQQLCDALFSADGLNVAVIHLNPFLHAQVVDFFTGCTADVTVTDGSTVTIVPRSESCNQTIERVSSIIRGVYGEANEIKQVGLAD